jgi:hypothetical protein
MQHIHFPKAFFTIYQAHIQPLLKMGLAVYSIHENSIMSLREVNVIMGQYG